MVVGSAVRKDAFRCVVRACSVLLSVVVDEHPPLAFMLFDFDRHVLRLPLLRFEFSLVLCDERANVVRHR